MKDFFIKSSIATLKLSPRSPDINITENLWKMISDMVYGRPQPISKQQLADSIIEAFFEININRRNILLIYKTFRTRLCEVQQNNRKLCK